jgi:hypothetical protein
MKKWHFTLKNGAFYPRIQSILAFFLSVFWEVKINLFCGRKRIMRNYDLWEIVMCENVMWVCVSLPARALRTRGTSGTRPPTSCRAFLLRTLPPPPRGSSKQKQRICVISIVNQSQSLIIVFEEPLWGGSARMSRHLLYMKWGPPTHPPPPLPPQRPQSSKK